MGTIGYPELIVIFLIVLLLFGGKKIPEIARGLGKGIKEFRKARDDIRDAIETEANEPSPETPDTGTEPDAAGPPATATDDAPKQPQTPE